MIRHLTLPTALLLCAGLSQASLAQGRSDDNPGKGKDGGAERAQGQKDDRGPDKADRDSGRADRPDRARGPDGAERADRPDQRAARDDRPGRDGGPLVVVERQGADRGRDRDRELTLVPYRDYGVLQGCPPGLAKKNNGCLPPGQAKKIERTRYDLAWRAPADGVRYRYDDGYQYRYNRDGSLLGYLPALGGALGVGNIWPTQYRYDPAPAYQRDYFGLNQPYDYRYADGAIYAVDPKTSAIQQVAALLTGQTANVGQRMPPGYDIYNVPYAYRDQYADSAAAAYRYNDGALYQLDPKTQVIQAVIQLLT